MGHAGRSAFSYPQVVFTPPFVLSSFEELFEPTGDSVACSTRYSVARLSGAQAIQKRRQAGTSRQHTPSVTSLPGAIVDERPVVARCSAAAVSAATRSRQRRNRAKLRPTDTKTDDSGDYKSKPLARLATSSIRILDRYAHTRATASTAPLEPSAVLLLSLGSHCYGLVLFDRHKKRKQ